MTPRLINSKKSGVATPPTCYSSLSSPSGRRKRGCPRECPKGCPRALWAPGSGVSKMCPESVPGVSKKVSGTPGTLSGHFLDTPEPGAQRALGTPLRTRPRTPPFSGTPSGTLSGHFGGGGTPKVTFEPLLGHFNSFCASVELGGRPLHKSLQSSRPGW